MAQVHSTVNSEPRVCLCGQGRSGTSMMMRVLRAGGLTLDVEPELPPEALAALRNPHGVFENRKQLLRATGEKFVNSFKLIDPTLFARVPADYRVIFISRPLEQILKSWEEVANRLGNKTAEVYRSHARTHNAAWGEVVSKLTGVLVLDYNAVAADPAKMARSVAGYLDTHLFAFDQAAAAAAVDTALYINRA
jgi:hypothetical protein